MGLRGIVFELCSVVYKPEISLLRCIGGSVDHISSSASLAFHEIDGNPLGWSSILHSSSLQHIPDACRMQ